MASNQPSGPTGWNEDDSQTFIEFGKYFVPDRDRQMQLLCDLIPQQTQVYHIVELCCGEGLLAEGLLAQHPPATVQGLDGSVEMLRRAQARLAPYGQRFTAETFDLASSAWRRFARPVHAFVSSMAIHHLDAAQKQALCRDIYNMLAAGGVFVIADVIQPVHDTGLAAAAQAWDDAVRRQALELDGHTRAFDYFQQHAWNIFRYPDPMDKPSGLFEQLAWLADAGFVDVDVYWVKAGHAIFGGCKASIPAPP